jgi:hypothetical protein
MGGDRHGETRLKRFLSSPRARRVAELYRQRWTIEQVFRVMKTQGFDIEAVPIQENAPLKNLACATLIAAIQIQQMLNGRDGQANRPMEDVFDPDDKPMIEAIGKTLEGRTQRQKNPHPPGSLAHAGWICARLGGWTGYYGKQRPIVMIRGFVQLQTMLEGIKRSDLSESCRGVGGHNRPWIVNTSSDKRARGPASVNLAWQVGYRTPLPESCCTAPIQCRVGLTSFRWSRCFWTYSAWQYLTLVSHYPQSPALDVASATAGLCRGLC